MSVQPQEMLSLAERLERMSPDRMIGEKGTTFLYSEDVKAMVDAMRRAARGAGVIINEDSQHTVEDMEALDRLVKIAMGNTGQSRRVANFLLAWWNATDNGGFDFTDLWNVDLQIARDMLTVFALIANCRYYADHYGFEAEFRQLVTDWRKPKCAKAGAS